MMMRARPTLAELLAQTDAVEEAIHAGDWQQAASLEAERRHQLTAFIAAEAAAGTVIATETRGALEDLHGRSQRLLGEVHHRRRQLVFEATALHRGRTAVRAYHAELPAREPDHGS